VHGLLGFARAGARPEQGASAASRQVIHDVLTGLGPTAQERSVALVLEEPFAECHVGCSSGVLTSIVSNLVLNAIKYIGDGPSRRVTVRAREIASMVRVEVEDTGPGLGPSWATIEMVFDPFVRGPSRDHAGIGLGLATVKRLVEGHGGRVGVHSDARAGCLFWFEIPKSQGATDEVDADAASPGLGWRAPLETSRSIQGAPTAR
jgi:signal transduction histidine kinase